MSLFMQWTSTLRSTCMCCSIRCRQRLSIPAFPPAPLSSCSFNSERGCSFSTFDLGCSCLFIFIFKQIHTHPLTNPLHSRYLFKHIHSLNPQREIFSVTVTLPHDLTFYSKLGYNYQCTPEVVPGHSRKQKSICKCDFHSPLIIIYHLPLLHCIDPIVN